MKLNFLKIAFQAIALTGAVACFANAPEEMPDALKEARSQRFFDLRRGTERAFSAEIRQLHADGKPFDRAADLAARQRFHSRMIGILLSESHSGTNLVRDVSFDRATGVLVMTFDSGVVQTNVIKGASGRAASSR